MKEMTSTVFRLDVQNEYLVTIEKVIQLKKKEYAVLHFLISNPNRLLKKDEILSAVWPDTIVSENSVKEYVRDLRKLLSDDPKSPAYIKTEHGKGYRFIGKIEVVNEVSATSINRPSVDSIAKKSNVPIVFVLPYEVIMGGSEWHLFSYGLSADLVTDLARIADINVVPRAVSESVNRSTQTDYREFKSSDMPVYVLDGSIQTKGTEIKIQSWLVDTSTGFIFWTDKFISTSGNLFDIQNTIVERIAMTIGGLDGEILRNENKGIKRKRPSSLKAYELYLAGYECEKKFDLANTIKGIKLIKQAIEMEPEFARAWTILGFLYNNAISLQIIDKTEIHGYSTKANEAVIRAHELDPRDPIAIIELGAMHARNGNLDFARLHLERAKNLINNNIDGHVQLAKYTFFVLNQPKEAEILLDQYIRYTPNPPSWYYLQKLRICYFSSDYEGALTAAKCIPKDIDAMLYTILSYIQIGETKKALSAKLYLEKKYPQFDHSIVFEMTPIVFDSHKKHFLDGLFKAKMIKQQN